MATLSKSILNANGIVRSSKKSNELYCAICAVDTCSDDWQKHIENPTHVGFLERFNLVFGRQDGSQGTAMIYCKICNAHFNWDELKNHAEWHKIIPWYKPNNLLKKFFENHILEWETQFYCYLCDVIFLEWSAAFVHIADTKHYQTVKAEPQLDKSFSLAGTELSYELLVSNGLISIDGANISCKICSCHRFGLVNVVQHALGTKHVKSKIAFKDVLMQRKDRELREKGLTECFSQTKESSMKQAKAGESTNGLCLKDKKVTSEPAGQGLSCDYIVKLAGTKSCCKVCDVEISDCTSVKTHVAGQAHAMALKKYGCDNISLKKGNDYYYCRCCHCILQSWEIVYIHVKGEQHIRSLANKQTSASKKVPIKVEIGKKPEVPIKAEIGKKPEVRQNTSHQTTHCDYIAKVSNSDSRCKICNIQLIGKTTIDNHLAGKRHERALKQYGCDNIVLKGGDYYCRCCKCKVSGIENVYLHVKGYRHSISLNVLDKQEAQKSNKIANGLTSVKQPELKTLLTSLTSELSRLAVGMEVTKKRRTRKPRSKRKRQVMIPIAHTTCNVCNASVANSADLHIHLASHFSEGFDCSDEEKDSVEKINNTSKTEEIDQSGNRNSQLTSANLSTERTKQTQAGIVSKDNNMNDLGAKSNSAKSKFVNISNGTIKKQNSDDENSTSSRSSTINLKTVIDNPGSKERSPTKSTARNIAELDVDYIYDMKEKLREIEFGMKLSLVIDSENIYCLICQKLIANTLQNYYDHLCSLDHCEYRDGMEKDHALFELVPEQFSSLDLASQYMEEISDDAVRCLVCNMEIKNTENALQDHMENERHEQTCKEMHAMAKRNFQYIESRRRCDWYSVKKYWCVPCSAKMQSEVSFVKHLKSPQHANFMKKSENTKNELIYDCCVSCALLWYGHRSTYPRHCEDASHNWLKRDGHYLSPDLPKIVENLLATLEVYIEEKITYLDKVSAQEFEKEKKLISDIEKSAKLKFTHAKAYPFGSRVSGLGSADSDIDIFLDCGNMYNGEKKSQDEMLRIMTDVRQCLSENSQSWNLEEFLPHCRSPLMKVYHIATGLSCDISFENGLSVENTKLVKCFNDKFPLCRKMILFLKQWLLLSDLSGCDRITSYALYWHVIFYLQKESILPSIATLIAMKNKSHVIAGWEVGVTHEFTYNEAESNFSIKQLLIRFFTFYANFDYRYDVACPIIGDVVKKRAFAEIQNLPKEMAPYIAYMKQSDDTEPLRIDSPMCMQDPFDLSHNITKAVNKVFLNRFRTYCSKSLDALCSSEIL